MAFGKINLVNEFGEISENNVQPIGSPTGPEFKFASGAGLYSGTGAPAFACTAGSMYLRVDGGSNAAVMYVNYDGGSGHWSALT